MSNGIFRIFNPEGKYNTRHPEAFHQSKDEVLMLALYNQHQKRTRFRSAARSSERPKSESEVLERYVKDLERDVSESRSHMMKLVQDNEQLGNTIHSLLGLLQQQGLPIPPGLTIPQLRHPVSTVTGTSPTECSEASIVNPVASPSRRARICVADLDPTELGVEFVLT
ncbi:hypothetical protein N0V82_006927 [Gnomoniopsis sp. IMI 355080]|nr:hypothetical protein N0V82_006927 [Gnomoniopsis sp. IMI 355080]